MESHRLNQWGGNYRQIITMYVHRIGFQCRPMHDTLDQTTLSRTCMLIYSQTLNPHQFGQELIPCNTK